ncbi:hypothetical protein HU200_040979 [Digitaria exilis]|uniref:Uncharacterized protein n=1 Tax=Digitaria exilis TaxID=1010633 RepID=A0A835BJ77_9POAL|nr:hypothetical protein HU200_040979 [Digitaria exilis]
MDVDAPQPVLNVDLNIPLQEDMGDVEDLIQDDDNVVMPPPEPEDVIYATSESSESNGLPPMIPDDVPEDYLLGDAQALVADPNEEQPDLGHDNNLMQLEFVQMVEPEMDPVFSTLAAASSNSIYSGTQSSSLPPDLFCLWSQNFAPGLGAESINVPPEWAAFITASLLNPSSFEWAKRFLNSPAWAFFSQPQTNDFAFALPSKCPATQSVSFLVEAGESSSALAEEIIMLEVQNENPTIEDDSAPHSPDSNTKGCLKNVSPSTGPWSKSLLISAGKLKLSEEDPSIRRSCRQRKHNKGFKGVTYKDKSCIACDAKPPTISPSIIKNLGTTFCKLDPEQLADPILLRKKKLAAPVVKKPIAKTKKKVADVDDKENTPKKKSKK